MSIGSTSNPLGAAVRSLQQVLDAPEAAGKLTPEEFAQRAEAKGFADRDLAVRVWRHLEQRQAAALENVVQRRVSEEEISKALFFVLLDDEATPARRSQRGKELSASFRSVLRDLASRLGVALDDIAEVVSSTGMGFSPSLVELADEFAALLDRLERSERDG